VQINRVGIGLLTFFGVFGALFVVVPIALGADPMIVAILALLGVIWMLTAFGLGLYARHQRHKAAHQDWIFENGLKGTATIVKAGSHATVNDMPLMALQLDLDIPGVGTRQVKRREVMPVFTAKRMHPDLVLTAYFNPQDQDDFILVW
jgi:preprotein translocase subunit SecG